MSMTRKRSEAGLIRRARSGDQLAMHHLYQQHVDAVWRVAMRILQRSDLAEDCVQEAFVKAFSQLPTLRDGQVFGGWLYRITCHTAIDLYRSESRRDQRGLVPDQPLMIEESNPDPKLRERLVGAIASLDAIYADVLILYHLLGHQHHEIAEILDIPIGSSKRRLSVARSHLRSLLADFRP